LAIGHSFGDCSAGLWDVVSRRLLWEAHDSTAVGIVGFTAGEEALVTAGKTVQALSVESGRCLRAIPVRPYNGVAALHPSGSALVALHGNSHLVVIDFVTGKPIEAFTLEYLADFSPFQMMYRALVMQAAEGARKKMVRTIERQIKEVGAPEDFEQWKAEALHPETVSTEAVRHILFSADGRFLFCATVRAGWIFNWETLLASGEPTPKPLHRFCPHPDTSYKGIFVNLDTERMVFSLAHDVLRGLLLLGTGDGAIHQIDLGAGASRLLMQMPDALPVLELGFSRDGTALYAILCPFFKDLSQPDRPPNRFQIYDCSKLRASAR